MLVGALRGCLGYGFSRWLGFGGIVVCDFSVARLHIGALSRDGVCFTGQRLCLGLARKVAGWRVPLPGLLSDARVTSQGCSHDAAFDEVVVEVGMQLRPDVSPAVGRQSSPVGLMA
jgi:hypothetical protein